MNAKMDSRPLLNQIRTDVSNTTATFTIQKSMLLNQNFYYTVLRRLITLIQNYQLQNCSKILFTQNSYHIKTSQLICIVNQLAGFFMVQIFTEGYFGNDRL